MGEMAEALLDDVVAVFGGVGQFVEVGIKICGQVGTITETREGAAGREMDGDRIGVDVVEELGSGRCAK